uniref:Ribonuclease H protein At1g65750 family n=1 Tax=Cajanus cajan TaxID=3821 RepID=A0A151S5S3_CAJCA|nr:Putative ribonuclease H protein At1g65750 family [Cajanus cajan]
MERLALRISELHLSGFWNPLSLSQGGLKLTHLFFADDVMLFCQASVNQVELVNNILKEFSEASEAILGIRHTTRIKKYLGTPMIIGSPKIADFHGVVDKINARLASWKGKLLNKAGKLCLIKSTVSPMLVYNMHSLWLPSAVCNKVNHACRSLLWSNNGSSRFWSHVGWEVVTKSKDYGGLGLCETRTMNVALLGKLLWDFVENPTKPWVCLLSHKYLNSQSILCATKQRGSSQVWLSIVKGMGKLREGFRPCLADGQSSMWFDDWLGVGALGRLVQFVHISDSDRNVASFWEQGRWKFDSMSTILPFEIAIRVQQVQVPLVQSGRDTFAWIGEASGCYTVSSGVKFWSLPLI